MSQTTRPSAALMTIGSSVPMKPRSALAKSRRSLKSAAADPAPAVCSDISLPKTTTAGQLIRHPHPRNAPKASRKSPRDQRPTEPGKGLREQRAAQTSKPARSCASRNNATARRSGTGTGVALGARQQAQPLRVGPGLLQAGSRATGWWCAAGPRDGGTMTVSDPAQIAAPAGGTMSVSGLAQDDITRMRDQLFFEGPARNRRLSRFGSCCRCRR